MSLQLHASMSSTRFFLKKERFFLNRDIVMECTRELSKSNRATEQPKHGLVHLICLHTNYLTHPYCTHLRQLHQLIRSKIALRSDMAWGDSALVVTSSRGLGRLLGQEKIMDVGQHTATSDGDGTQQFRQLVVVSQGQLDMPRHDSGLLVVTRRIAANSNTCTKRREGLSTA